MTSIITFEQINNYYEEFKQNPPQDEYDRYSQEFNILDNLHKIAQHQKLFEEAEKYKKIKENLAKKLTAMGYKVQL